MCGNYTNNFVELLYDCSFRMWWAPIKWCSVTTIRMVAASVIIVASFIETSKKRSSIARAVPFRPIQSTCHRRMVRHPLIRITRHSRSRRRFRHTCPRHIINGRVTNKCPYIQTRHTIHRMVHHRHRSIRKWAWTVADVHMAWCLPQYPMSYPLNGHI